MCSFGNPRQSFEKKGEQNDFEVRSRQSSQIRGLICPKQNSEEKKVSSLPSKRL